MSYAVYLPADETMEVNTAERQNDNDWMKPASVARVIPGLEAVPESRPATSTPAKGIRCGSTAITSRLPSPGVTAPAKFHPRPSNKNQENASTQTYFETALGKTALKHLDIGLLFLQFSELGGLCYQAQ